MGCQAAAIKVCRMTRPICESIYPGMCCWNWNSRLTAQLLRYLCKLVHLLGVKSREGAVMKAIVRFHCLRLDYIHNLVGLVVLLCKMETGSAIKPQWPTLGNAFDYSSMYTYVRGINGKRFIGRLSLLLSTSWNYSNFTVNVWNDIIISICLKTAR